MAVHIVKVGETTSGIAAKYGIKSWQELYNHPSNAAFRARRPNPNLIMPGDQINIPASTSGVKAAPISNRLGRFARHEELMRRELRKNSPAHQAAMDEEFFRFLEATKGQWDTAVFIADRADDAVLIVNYYRAMKAFGLPLSEITGVVPIITKVTEGDRFIKALTQPGGKLGTVLRTVGRTGQVVSLVGLGVQVYTHYRRSDYYAAAGEVYRSGMGALIGWAGLVDATEGMVSALSGSGRDPKKDVRFWKYLKSINPIGLGTVAIDSVGTMIHTIITRDLDPRRMDRLVDRVRASPAQVFLEIGEDLAGALTYFEQMPEAEFREAMSASSFYNWIRYNLTGRMPEPPKPR